MGVNREMNGRVAGCGKRFWSLLSLCFLFACLLAGCVYAAGAEGVEGLKVRVLVAYETSKGSTAEIAETIAAEMRKGGVDALAASISDAPLPEDYTHVIVGGPIYMGSIKGVKGFVERHKAVLQERLIGAFAVGMSFAVEDEEKQAAGRKALDEAIAPLEVAHLGYFAGKIDMEKLSFLEKMAVKMVKSPVGDFRDWDAVKGWAQEVLMAVNRESGKP